MQQCDKQRECKVCFKQHNVSIYSGHIPMHLQLNPHHSINQQLDRYFKAHKRSVVSNKWVVPVLMEFLQNVTCEPIWKYNLNCLKISIWDNNSVTAFIFRHTVNKTSVLHPYHFKKLILTCV